MERPSVEVTSRAEWRAWLAAHHATHEGVWLVTHKKHAPSHVSYEEIVLEVPTDLAEALATRRPAWDALTRSARYQHLLALHDAKQTRAKRIAAVLAAVQP